MDITIFIISVYCIVDDFLKDKRLRQRGPQPTLSDSEVLTMEIVGEFLGIDTDSGIFRYFRRHYGDWFPLNYYQLMRKPRIYTSHLRKVEKCGPILKRLRE